jgi:hypothetical protein
VLYLGSFAILVKFKIQSDFLKWSNSLLKQTVKALFNKNQQLRLRKEPDDQSASFSVVHYRIEKEGADIDISLLF